MFCKYCGNELSENANFCPKCGKVVAKEEVNGEFDFFEEKQQGFAPANNPATEREKDDLSGQILKFAILSIAFASTFFLSLFGVIFSSIARSKINEFTRKFGETEGRASVGKGLNIGGTILSWVMFGIFLIYVVIIVALLGQGAGLPSNPFLS